MPADNRGIPVVGPQAANEVRLSPALRSLLRRRATRQVRRETRPQIQLLRQLLGSIRGQGDEQVAQVQAQVGAASDIAGDVSLQGLHGLERRQVKEDMAARQASYQQAVPLLTQGIRADQATDVAAAQEALLTAKADRATAIETTLSSALDSARTDAQAGVKAQEAARRRAAHQRQDRRKEQRGGSKQERREAMRAALRRIENVIVAKPEDGVWRLPVTRADWSNVYEAVQSAEGVDSDAAARAVEEARRYVEALTESGMSRADMRDRLRQSGLFPFGV